MPNTSFNGKSGASGQIDVAQGLEKLGYKQELSRSRGLLHILFMSLAILAVPYGLSAPIATSLVGGGPATIIWGWLLARTTGAIRLAPPRYRLLLSWINGWLYTVGVWTISLSVTFGTAQLMVAGATIFHPEWVATPWQTYLIFVALLPAIDVLAAFWTLFGIIIILIGFSAKAAAGRRSACFRARTLRCFRVGVVARLDIFHRIVAAWYGAQFPLGHSLLNIVKLAYTYAAIGMITSMAEEVHNPSIQVPQAIVYSIPIGAISGLAFLLPIVFTLPDIQTLLAVPGGQPIGVMFTLIMGSRSGGFGMWFIIFGIGIFCAISICCAASRATWSFARDKAIPFHTTFAHISRAVRAKQRTLPAVPLNAHLLSTTIQLLLGLIYLGSSTAFNAFVGVAVMCLGATYAMPIAILLFNGNGRKEMKRRAFRAWTMGLAGECGRAGVGDV
ncbi:putative amino acid permease [Lyophyllum shimeji]|uniref:Amino acid permease n=1 Tax=Lyophyllum shimeji TaxID=47721 RepID=A0A9P3UVS7_LYOSH|nr:putative amino acid permease [Lyophyllum shimeji]